MSSIEVWKDARSGLLGCMAGNIVLERIQKMIREKISHLKGTIFFTDSKIIVGRICTTDKYLQKGVVHFCNMSSLQTEAVAKEQSKLSFFLFITVSSKIIHYWMVPGQIVSKVIESLTPKPSSSSCFLRIFQKDDRFLLGGDVDITAYHQTIRNRQSSKLAQTIASVALQNQKSQGSQKGIPVDINLQGQRYEGVLMPTN